MFQKSHLAPKCPQSVLDNSEGTWSPLGRRKKDLIRQGCSKPHTVLAVDSSSESCL